MIDQLALAPGLHVVPTPLGALRAATARADGPAERMLRHLLRQTKPVTTDDLDLAAITGVDDLPTALTVVALAQDAGWVEGSTEAPPTVEGPLALELPALVAPLSDQGRAALIDDQGFSLTSVGFDPEAEEELTVLAAEVARLQQRRDTDASAATSATGWGLIDRHGSTTVAFVPLAIGPQSFVLILGGHPRLDHPALVLLAGALAQRYDPAPQPTTTGGPNHA